MYFFFKYFIPLFFCSNLQACYSHSVCCRFSVFTIFIICSFSDKLQEVQYEENFINSKTNNIPNYMWLFFVISALNNIRLREVILYYFSVANSWNTDVI